MSIIKPILSLFHTVHTKINMQSIKVPLQSLKTINTGLDKHNFFSIKLQIFSYPSAETYVLGAQKNRLIETVLLRTHNIYFG